MFLILHVGARQHFTEKLKLTTRTLSQLSKPYNFVFLLLLGSLNCFLISLVRISKYFFVHINPKKQISQNRYHKLSAPCHCLCIITSALHCLCYIIPVRNKIIIFFNVATHPPPNPPTTYGEKCQTYRYFLRQRKYSFAKLPKFRRTSLKLVQKLWQKKEKRKTPSSSTNSRKSNMESSSTNFPQSFSSYFSRRNCDYLKVPPQHC